jgi:hypothetical protein
MKSSFVRGGLAAVVLGGLPVLAANAPGGAAPAAAAPAPAGALAGKVAETMNAASYTYVLVDVAGKKVWAAAPQFPVKVGDTVELADAMPMANYHSKTLNRTFEVVYFSGDVRVNGQRPGGGSSIGEAAILAAAGLPAGHPPAAGAGPAAAPAPKAAPDLKGIKRADGGQTVAEIYAGKKNLAGKPIAVRGRVVKFNAQIMGKNWLHIRDGSGAEGTNDLTVTTQGTAKVGDLVLVTGKLSADKDFGGGYKYGLIVEDAAVKVE